MSVRRQARKAAADPAGAVAGAVSTSGLPAEFLDPDDPRWHDDDNDLRPYREWAQVIPPDIAAAVCRLGRWKRLISAAERFAIERGWVVTTPGSELQLVDQRRMAAEGVPLMAFRKERRGLVGASMWTAVALSGYVPQDEPAPF